MRRDMNIVRQIVKQIGDSEKRTFEGPFIFDRKVGDEVLYYHLLIMEDAGIIEGSLESYDDGELIIYSLYLGWQGNDFYETFKDDNVWEGTKSFLKSKGLEIANFPFELLMEAGKQMLLNQ